MLHLFVAAAQSCFSARSRPQSHFFWLCLLELPLSVLFPPSASYWPLFFCFSWFSSLLLLPLANADVCLSAYTSASLPLPILSSFQLLRVGIRLVQLRGCNGVSAHIVYYFAFFSVKSCIALCLSFSSVCLSQSGPYNHFFVPVFLFFFYFASRLVCAPSVGNGHHSESHSEASTNWQVNPIRLPKRVFLLLFVHTALFCSAERADKTRCGLCSASAPSALKLSWTPDYLRFLLSVLSGGRTPRGRSPRALLPSAATVF